MIKVLFVFDGKNPLLNFQFLLQSNSRKTSTARPSSASRKALGDKPTSLWNWSVHPERFKNGLTPVIELANQLGIKIGLWYSPDSAHTFANYQRKAAPTSFGLRRCRLQAGLYRHSLETGRKPTDQHDAASHQSYQGAFGF